ncbi:MAG: hypothetical protein IKO30_01675 [Lachnospiraceae bacterium]|nr:hypothetical protein [Lachnospiraceae bacterium]
MKSKNKLKRILSTFLATILCLTGTLTDIPPLGISTKNAEAATNFATLNNEIVAAAANYLGYNYDQPKRMQHSANDSSGFFDCSSLVGQVLKDVGITGAFNNNSSNYYTTAKYENDIINENLSFTVNGKTYSKANGNIIYCSTVADYNAALKNKAYADKWIVLKTTTNSKNITASETKGMIFVQPKQTISGKEYAAHMSIGIGQYALGTMDLDYKDPLMQHTGQITESELMHNQTVINNMSNNKAGRVSACVAYNSFIYTHNLYSTLNAMNGKTARIALTTTEAANVNAVKTALCGLAKYNDTTGGATFGSYPTDTEAYSIFYKGNTGVDHKPIMWDYGNTTTFSSGSHDYFYIVNDQYASGYYNENTGAIYASPWRIEARGVNSGVAITNMNTAKEGGTLTYAFRYNEPHYTSVSVKKTDTSGAGISDTAYFIALKTPSGVTADTVAKVRNYFLTKGKNYYSSQYDASSISTIMGASFGTTEVYNLSSTNGSVDTTSVYSDLSGDNRYYWIFEVGVPNNYDLNTDIFRLEVTPTSSTSGGGSATATRYTTSNTTSTTSVTATSQTGMGSNAAFSNGSSGGTVAVVTIKNSPIIFDQWLTWDLAKTEKGTNTNLANGGYIVVPSSNLGTTNYNGQDRDGAFRYLNNSDSTTNNRSSHSDTTGEDYANPTIAFQSLAKYANDNTTTAADAAKLFVQELGKLRGIDKVSGSYRYLSGSTWYQGQEF